MSSTLRAIETTGILEAEDRLQLEKPLPLKSSSRVRIIVLYSEDDDWNEEEWLKAAAQNSAFDFLKDPSEDIYTLNDGRPFHDQG